MTSIDRRRFLATSGTTLAASLVVGPQSAWPNEQAMSRAEEETSSFKLLRAQQQAWRADLFEPADYHRLPLSWHKAKSRDLRAKARERGIDGGLFLTNRWNVIYTTGLWHSTTERPFTCFLPVDDDDGVVWFHPHIDTDLVATWWSSRAFSYFDYHHADGAFPNLGQTAQGQTIDIPTWWGETLAKLGYGGKTIGIDSGSAVEIGVLPGQEKGGRLNMSGDYTVPQKFRPSGGAFGRMAAALPGSQFVDVSDLLVKSRMVKDEAENRLAQRAEHIWSEVHAFTRNYMIERGPGTIDQEVSNAANMWALHRIMRDIPKSNEPHVAVGITFGVSCRSGKATGYPHPNQMSYGPIARGDSVQVACWGGIGGCGGELYRSYLVAPWTGWQEKVWEVHTRSYEIQAEQSFVGNTCSNVAKAVHDYQIANGCAGLVYHRPGHGIGSEGHQPPYQALGDYTVMQKGMYFSNEPGLYDVKNGFGFNHSNCIVVWDRKGRQLGTAPVSKEWCLLRL